MAKIAIVGIGWRAEFFMRVAHALPDRFTVVGAVNRNAERGAEFSRKWGVPTFRTLDDLLAAEKPHFVVASVPRETSEVLLVDCAKRGLPVLGETPPAASLAGLRSVWSAVGKQGRVQIAEQYVFQPLHAARLAIAHSGLIGTPMHAQVSVAHGYHGISLMRRYLGVSFENASITATRFVSPIVESPGREGPPAEERIVDSEQVIAHFRFEGGKSGVFDFAEHQYFSYVRGPRVLVRGERGEIEGERVRRLLDQRSGVETQLQRVDAGHGGNLEGYHHKGYTMDGQWVYANEFAPARLSDDEIAVATALEKMTAYAQGGPDFYSLAEASQDQYLDLLMQEALETGKQVESRSQEWAD